MKSADIAPESLSLQRPRCSNGAAEENWRAENAEYQLGLLAGEKFRNRIALNEAQDELAIPAMGFGFESDQARQIIENAYRFYSSREPELNPVAAARIKLSDIEHKIEDEPELLLSADAIRAFALVKSNDPQEWERWRPIIAKHHKTRALLSALSDLKRSENVGRESQATVLVKLAQERAEFFHDNSEPFAAIHIADHVEVHSLKSRGFKRWLAQLYFETQKRAANSEAISGAINTLGGIALFKSDEVRTYVRVAEAADKTYLDLCDKSWRVIEIDKSGWRIIPATDCPVRFRRAPGMLALPEPERGGTIAELRPFLNVATDDDFRLTAAWLIAAFRNRGPFPVLGLHGEHGSAKSTASRILRSLLDPNAALLRSESRDPRDLMIAATNAWILAFDNLSKIGSWLSDALCRLATGGGFSTRALYSDSEETIFEAQRPTILNGIEELATRGDLLDRAIILYLPRIEDRSRMTETEFDVRFRAAQPRILGAILDAVSLGLRDLNSVRLERHPRMADFAVWAAATAPALGWSAGEFSHAYALCRRRANDLVLDSVVVETLWKLALPWSGTATDLLAEINEIADERAKRSTEWPKSGRALSNELRRLAPNLRQACISVDFKRQGKLGTRIICIGQSESKDETASASSVEGMPSTPLDPGADAPADAGDDVYRMTRSERQPANSTSIWVDDLADGADAANQRLTDEDGVDL